MGEIRNKRLHTTPHPTSMGPAFCHTPSVPLRIGYPRRGLAGAGATITIPPDISIRWRIPLVSAHSAPLVSES